MGVVLITVVRGTRRRDLAVRSDVPVAVLLRPLLDALAAGPGEEARRAWGVTDPAPNTSHRHGGADPSSEPPDLALALAPVCGPTLPRNRSLEACGVGHGAVLVLLDRPATVRA
jgi:hypothetical protein